MAFENLRRPDGSWVQLEVTLPTGATAPVYNSIDKNKQQSQRERFGKVLHRAIQAVTDLPVHCVRRDGICTINWTEVAKAIPQEDGSCVLHFNGDAVKKHNLDREEIKKRFSELTSSRPASSVQWSV